MSGDYGPALFSALVVAAITAISFVAYKHPNAYRLMYIPIAGLYVLITAASLAWNAGVEFTVQTLIEYLKTDKMLEAVGIARSYKVPLWMTLVLFRLLVYLIGLQFLPQLLRENDSEKKKHK